MEVDLTKPCPEHTCYNDGYDKYGCHACDWQKADDAAHTQDFQTRLWIIDGTLRRFLQNLKQGQLAALEVAIEKSKHNVTVQHAFITLKQELDKLMVLKRDPKNKWIIEDI